MSTCSTSSLLANSAQFAALPPGMIFPVKLALLCRILHVFNPGADCSPQTLISRASCFICLPPGVMRILKLQLLCQLVSGATVPCVNVIPEGATYNGANSYSPTLVPNTNYKLTAGINDNYYVNEGGPATSITNGEIVFVTTGPTATFQLVSNSALVPVTATICLT